MTKKFDVSEILVIIYSMPVNDTGDNRSWVDREELVKRFEEAKSR